MQSCAGPTGLGLKAFIFAALTGLALGRPISAGAMAASLIHAGGIFKGSPGAAECYLFLNKADMNGSIQTGREIVRLVKAAAPERFKRILIGSLVKKPPVIEFYDRSLPLQN